MQKSIYAGSRHATHLNRKFHARVIVKMEVAAAVVAAAAGTSATPFLA